MFIFFNPINSGVSAEITNLEVGSFGPLDLNYTFTNEKLLKIFHTQPMNRTEYILNSYMILK